MSSSNENQYTEPQVLNDFNSKDPYEIFYEWLKLNKVEGLETFEISDFTEGERGVKALRDIKENEESPQLRVPNSLIITVDNTLKHPTLGKILSDTSIYSNLKENKDAILAIRLMYEKLNPKSPWKPYIDVLPKTYNSTIYWNDKDIQSLESGNLYYLTRNQNYQIDKDYTEIFKKLFKKYPNEFKKRTYKLSDFKWALSTIWSRAIDVKINGKLKRILVPMMDMFNHSFDAKSTHTFNEKENCFELKLQHSTTSGSQAFINYGPIGNTKLLLLYGFTVHKNPHDYVELIIQLAPNAELYDLKVQILKQRGLSPTQVFYLKMSELDEFPVDILGTARIQRLTQDDLSRVQYAFDKYEIVSEVNEVLVLKALEEAFQTMYEAYKTESKADLDLYTKLEEGNLSNLNPNEIHSLRIRMSDRYIIATAGNHIKERISQIQEYLMSKIRSGNTENL